MTTVSVCIPVWNGVAFVGATIRSVLDQTWKDLEVVAVDDHSTDGSYELLCSIDDPRLRVVRTETRTGAAGAWNRAMAEARGRYVKLLCHDDTLLPTCLEAQVSALDGDPGAALVAGRRHITDTNGRILLADRGLAGLDPGPVSGSDALRATVRAGTNLFGEPACVLMRAEAVARTGGFDGTLPYVIDLDYWCRLLRVGHLIALPDTVATFRVTAGSWSVALASAQTRQIVALFRRLRHEPGNGVTTADVALGAARAAALQSGRSALYRFLRYRARPEPGDTRSGEYTDRLVRIAGARWKRLLGDRDPYRRNLRRWMGSRRTLDVGCGIGRNLAHLGPGSVGVDHSPESVRYCRERGLDAYLPDEFLASSRAVAGSFTGLVCAHVLEHLEPGAAPTVLKPYVDLLAPGSRVMLVCPQERGFASDPTHTVYVDQAALAAVCAELGLTLLEQRSFPLPAWAGRWFIYNEFVTIATKGS